MKLIIKILITTFLIILFIVGIGLYFYNDNPKNHIPSENVFTCKNIKYKKLHSKCLLAKSFAEQHHLSTSYSFLIDMNEPSGKDRFYVYDTKKDSIAAFGLVAHGCGKEEFARNPTFSNQPNSYCTALGRYRIGGKYKGQFGDAWKLKGLDSSNDKSFDRNIVLHAYDCVPDVAPYPLPICNSKGCPMVSYTFLKILKGYIEATDKPILLWIYKD